MKVRQVLASALVIGSLAFATAASAATATVKTTYANLRADANSKSQILGKLDRGTKLDVLGNTGVWIQVKSGDKTGYVHKNLLTIRK